MDLINKKIILSLLIFYGCCSMSLPADSKIIFWKYNNDISFEKLSSFNLDDAYKSMEAVFGIPLDDFNLYFWDEQVLRMNISVYEDNNYSEYFTQIMRNTDLGSLFFSIIINNKIVLNGLNRVILMTAAIQPYDDSKYPRFSPWARNNKYIYFRISYRPTSSRISIWNIPETFGDINLLFVDAIYNFFESSGKIQRGRLNIINYGNNEDLTFFPFFKP